MTGFSALDVARFWSKVDVGEDDECWPWKAGIGTWGYGEFKVRHLGKGRGAHRVAYALIHDIDLESLDGQVIRHTCDRPSCCNPFHHLVGSHNDNVSDRVLRGRSAKGTGNGNHKLIEAEVIAILDDARSNSAIGRAYGVHTDTIRCIKTGKTWRHLQRANDNAETPPGTTD